jgi:hypothetical protein
MLDHFEHIRFQIVNGATKATAFLESDIVDTFSSSPLLCQHFQQNARWYGGGGPGTLGDWARQGCNRRRQVRRVRPRQICPARWRAWGRKTRRPERLP